MNNFISILHSQIWQYKICPLCNNALLEFDPSTFTDYHMTIFSDPTRPIEFYNPEFLLLNNNAHIYLNHKPVASLPIPPNLTTFKDLLYIVNKVLIFQ